VASASRAAFLVVAQAKAPRSARVLVASVVARATHKARPRQREPASRRALSAARPDATAHRLLSSRASRRHHHHAALFEAAVGAAHAAGSLDTAAGALRRPIEEADVDRGHSASRLDCEQAAKAVLMRILHDHVLQDELDPGPHEKQRQIAKGAGPGTADCAPRRLAAHQSDLVAKGLDAGDRKRRLV